MEFFERVEDTLRRVVHQRGGWRVALFAEPFNAAAASAMIFVVSVPTTTFVPISTVIGRSVFSRNVRQGMPSAVVSS